MNTGLLIIAVVASFFCGFGVLAALKRYEESKKTTPLAGYLIVDKTDPEIGGGVYTQFLIDPKSLETDQTITLAVVAVDGTPKKVKDRYFSSQQKQTA